MNDSIIVESRFRVRYAETDQMGVAHNSVYLIWFEMGRTDYCHARDYPYSRIEAEGFVMVVAESRVRYKKPAYYDDVLVVKTALTKSRPKVFQFNYEITRPATGDLIAEGETIHVSIDKETGRPTRLPQNIIDTLNSAR